MQITAPLWAHGAAVNYEPPSRNIHTVFVHCSASDKANHDDVSVMRNWHVNGNGWSDVGYNYFITKKGHIQAGRPVSRIPAGQKGHNNGTIAICCHGLKEELFTAQQFQSLIAFCQAVNAAYSSKEIRFRGHKEVANKACPVFNYKAVLGLDSEGYMTGTPSHTPIVNPPPVDIPRPSNNVENLDKGKAVTLLQSVLVVLGAGLTIDGVFGQMTMQAVQSFQKKHFLEVSGSVDTKTKAAMITALTGSGIVLKRPAKGDKVKALQFMLNLAGAALTTDGDFGKLSEMAVSKFQQQNKLSVDGEAGPKTLTALAKKLFGM